ncbi:MAG: thiolase family protein [Chloroflexi bacterium]|nr:thiolase family protein [Chloroflexota bacterium]
MAVIGVGMHPFGRFPEKRLPMLGAEAVLAALGDAALRPSDIPIAYSATTQAGMLAGQGILREAGISGIPVTNVENGCASGSSAFREAYLAVASGRYDIALAVGAEKLEQVVIPGMGRPDGISREHLTQLLELGEVMGYVETVPEGHVGTVLMPGVFAMLAMEHMQRYGSTVEHFARVSVKNHEHALANPNAHRRRRITVEDVLASRPISEPLTLYMCCPTGDGAAAVVLSSMEVARRHSRRPIRIAASALASAPYSSRDLALMDVNSVSANCAREAYAEAGLGPEDLDIVELHDAFAPAEMLHYESLGLCAEGESGRLLDEGVTRLGGRLPVNTSGGLLAQGHPFGATGLAQVCELVWQLRGRAGERQVPGAKVGLAHCLGMSAACAVHILTR